MKRKLITGVLLIAAVLTTALCAWASWINYPNIHGSIWEAWSGDYGSGIQPATGNLYFWTKSGGKISLYETPSITAGNRILEASASGVIVDKSLSVNGTNLLVTAATKVTEFSRPATVINSTSQLSTWTGQAAINGVSWYQLEPGKVYEVDIAALAHSQTGYICSGVTLLMWDATALNDQRPSTITIIPPTGSTPASDVSGTTIVYVMPNPGMTGLTAYGIPAQNYAVAYRSACTPQSLQGDKEAVANDGVLTAGAVVSGTSIMVLNKIGESLTMQTRNNTGISAFVVAHSLKK